MAETLDVHLEFQTVEQKEQFKAALAGFVKREQAHAAGQGAPREPNSVTDEIARFLTEIGIGVRWEPIEEPTVLPGINIDRGTLVVDRTQLQYPGDLLHEAGHLAVIPADERVQVDGDANSDAAREMMAIAWSYAALCHLGLDPSVVFHEGGYSGSRTLLANFRVGRYFGADGLQWLSMTADAQHAAELGIEPYPKMRKWLL